jgi:hypothetical protein
VKLARTTRSYLLHERGFRVKIPSNWTVWDLGQIFWLNCVFPRQEQQVLNLGPNADSRDCLATILYPSLFKYDYSFSKHMSVIESVHDWDTSILKSFVQDWAVAYFARLESS